MQANETSVERFTLLTASLASWFAFCRRRSALINPAERRRICQDAEQLQTPEVKYCELFPVGENASESSKQVGTRRSATGGLPHFLSPFKRLEGR